MTLIFFYFQARVFLVVLLEVTFFLLPYFLPSMKFSYMYFAITIQNTLKWIQNSWILSLFLSFFLSVFSLYMKFPYILTLITKNTLKWIKNILSFLSLLSIFYPIFSLSLSLSLSLISLLSLLCFIFILGNKVLMWHSNQEWHFFTRIR